MDKTEESRRYKWTNSATNLLVSIWCHDLIQRQLRTSTRNQTIWESIARYMHRKGYIVTGLQCRTRIKNMLCTYQECVKKNDFTGIKPYHNIFKTILSKKNPKKKDQESLGVKKYLEKIIVEDINLDSVSNERNQTDAQSRKEKEQEIEFFDVSNIDFISFGNSNEGIKKLQNVILNAINIQTKTITKAVQEGYDTIEKLLLAQKEKLETLISCEQDNRKYLEDRLNRLLPNIDVTIVP